MLYADVELIHVASFYVYALHMLSGVTNSVLAFTGPFRPLVYFSLLRVR
jgi:hypothetical protein